MRGTAGSTTSTTGAGVSSGVEATGVGATGAGASTTRAGVDPGAAGIELTSGIRLVLFAFLPLAAPTSKVTPEAMPCTRRPACAWASATGPSSSASPKRESKVCFILNENKMN